MIKKNFNKKGTHFPIFLLLICLCLTFSSGLFSQNFQWVKQLEGTGTSESVSDIYSDVWGNIYTVGSFNGTCDFNPDTGTFNLTSAGQTDAFICKFNNQGGLAWAKSIGSTWFDGGLSVCVDPNGNVYTTGTFSGTVDFDPGIGTYTVTSTPGNNFFVHKLDASGSFVWVKTFGSTGAGGGLPRKISIRSGHLFVSGDFHGTMDFNPNVGTYNMSSVGGSNDCFVLKLDFAGNFIWAKSFGGSGLDYCLSHSIDFNGNIYTTGYFTNTSDFDPSLSTFNLTSFGSQDVFINKLDSSGNFVWAKKIGGNSIDVGKSICVDTSGNIYITGCFQTTADFDPGVSSYTLTSTGNDDAFICKLNQLGNFVWAKQLVGSAGSNPDCGNSITTHINGDVYITGYFYSTVDFDPGIGTYTLTSTGSGGDGFILKLTTNGNFDWVFGFDGPGNSMVDCIYVNNQGSIYTSGTFSGDTVNFGPIGNTSKLYPTGGSDVFIHKISQCIKTTSSISINNCNNYVSPSGNYTWTTTGIYLDTITNVAGCDSIITINLTINTINKTTTLNGVAIMSNEAGATYQWLNCNTGYSIISGATAQTYTATANGSYAVAITKNGCADTSACTVVNSVGFQSIISEISTQINIYPNPNNGNFYINIYGEDVELFELYSISGQRVFSQQLGRGNHQIQLTNFSEGVYYFEAKGVSDNKYIHRGKIIISF